MAGFKDLMLRGLFAVAVLWACHVAIDMHKELRARQLQNPDATPAYSDLVPALGVAFGMTVAQLLFRPLFSVVARGMIVKKARWNYAVWGAKVIRCCDAVFKFSYYAAMITWGTSVLRGKPWVPWVFGGQGQTRFCWTDGYPFQESHPDLLRFYLTSVGYAFSEVAMLLIDKQLPDFWEMMLHHTIACFLLCFSFLLGYVRIGTLVLLLHDISDVFIYASKAIVDTPWIHLIAVSYFGLAASFVWFRIYVFPVYIMRSAWVESVTEVDSDREFGWGFLNFALCVLLLLHMYWFGLIVKSGLVFRKTGQPKDLQSNLSNLEYLNKKQS